MPLSGILGGFETLQKQFFLDFLRFLEPKNKMKKRGKIKISGKKSENVGNYQKKSEIIEKIKISVEIFIDLH